MSEKGGVFLKALILSILTGVWMAGCGSENEKTPVVPNNSIVFADARLETVVREALEKPAGELTEEEVLPLAHLDASARGIADLRGIEQLKNLEVLKLAGNQIQNISPLTAMARLCTLDLKGNKVENIAPLSSLPQLCYLDLSNNMVRDLGPLFSLRTLTHVDLSGNPLDENSATSLAEALTEKGIEVVIGNQPTQEAPGTPQAVPIDFHLVFSSGMNKSTLWVIPANSNKRLLLSEEPYGVYDLCWSPAGERIGFLLAKGTFYTIAPDGTRKTKLFGTSSKGFSLLSGPSWSPDGQRILLEALKAGTDQRDIITVAADGSDMRNLTDDPLMDFRPRWSPDGQQILFYKNTDPGFSFSAGGNPGDFEVFVMDTDGRNSVNLTNDPLQDLEGSWSPDGNQIAFTRGDGVTSDIYAMDTDGSNLRRLTNDSAINSSPIWSPDGHHIAFIQWPDLTFTSSDILVMEVDGKQSLALTDHVSHNTGPQWSPDGSKVAFLSDRDGHQDIYMVDVDGSNLVNVTQDTTDVATFAIAPK